MGQSHNPMKFGSAIFNRSSKDKNELTDIDKCEQIKRRRRKKKVVCYTIEE